MDDPARPDVEHDEHIQDAEAAVIAVKKSHARTAWA
jgi:hypothetical protein